jgi:hypothetical protein
MPEDHRKEERLKRIAQSVSSVPAGMDRWRRSADRDAPPAGFWSRLAFLRPHAQLVAMAGAMAAVFALALVGYHANQHNAGPSPAHGISTPSPTATATLTMPVTVTPTSPNPTPKTSPGPTLALTYAQHSKTFTVRVGTTITVHLAPADKLSGWTLPITRNDTGATNLPQLPRLSARNNPDGSVDATFVAKSADPNRTIIASWADGHPTSGVVDFGVGIIITA